MKTRQYLAFNERKDTFKSAYVNILVRNYKRENDNIT